MQFKLKLLTENENLKTFIKKRKRKRRYSFNALDCENPSYYKNGDRIEKYKFESVYILLQAKDIL